LPSIIECSNGGFHEYYENKCLKCSGKYQKPISEIKSKICPRCKTKLGFLHTSIECDVCHSIFCDKCDRYSTSYWWNAGKHINGFRKKTMFDSTPYSTCSEDCVFTILRIFLMQLSQNVKFTLEFWDDGVTFDLRTNEAENWMMVESSSEADRDNLSCRIKENLGERRVTFCKSSRTD